MFIEQFVGAWLGHFVGDYVLQNQWMALGKTHEGMKGHIACTVHVTLYTLAVLHFSGVWSLPFAAAVFIPHWIIDRYGLAWYWLDFKNGFSHKDLWEKGPVCAQPPKDLAERNSWKVSFAAPVYIFNDNTFHWVCLWYAVKWLGK